MVREWKNKYHCASLPTHYSNLNNENRNNDKKGDWKERHRKYSMKITTANRMIITGCMKCPLVDYFQIVISLCLFFPRIMNSSCDLICIVIIFVDFISLCTVNKLRIHRTIFIWQKYTELRYYDDICYSILWINNTARCRLKFQIWITIAHLPKKYLGAKMSTDTQFILREVRILNYSKILKL